MRIILADNHPHILRALKMVLQEEPGFVLVGEAEDVRTLLTVAAAEPADLILLDQGLPGAPIEDQIAALHALASRPRVIVMSSDPDSSRLMLRAGADAFVSKSDQTAWLLDALHIHAARLNRSRE